MKRIIVCLLFMPALLLCSCQRDTDPGYFQSFRETSEICHENGVSDSDIVFSINGYDISYSEFRYYFLSEKALLTDQQWNSYSDEEKQKWVKKTVIADILFPRSAALRAHEYSITLNQDEIDAVDTYIDQVTENLGGKEQLNTNIAQYFMTPELYRFITMQDQLTTKLLEYYTDETTTPVKADDQAIQDAVQNGELIHVKHILICNDEEDNEQENLLLAQSILAELDAGADFDTLVKQYSEDPGLENEPDGYYIFRYEMNKAFEQAAFSLAEGETSAVVPVFTDTYSGYHIIRRYEITDSYLNEHINALRSNYMASCFYQDIEQIAQQAQIVYSDLYASLSLDEIQ